MATCVVKDCNSALDASLKYFKFPRSRLLRKAWLNAVPVASDITTDTFVCSKHFTDDDFEIIKSKRVLRTHAVPRIYDTPNMQAEEENIAETDVATENAIKSDIATESVNESDVATENVNASNVAIEYVDKSDFATKNVNASDVAIENVDKSNIATENVDKSDVVTDNVDKSDVVTENINKSDVAVENVNEKQVVLQVNSDETQNGPVKTHNGNDCQKDIQDTTIRKESQAAEKRPEENDPKDIEEIIKHYHIRQDISKRRKENGLHGSVNRENARQLPENPFTNQNSIFSDIIEAAKNQKDIANFNYHLSPHQVEFISDLVDKLAPNQNQYEVEKQPTYIEVSTKDKTAGNRSDSPQDCYMLLEDVQVELDPSNFFHDEEDIHDLDLDNSPDKLKEKLDDPISLLTSSDEDDVIIQEPHIDTVEVSDETDEDDMPLVRLLKSKQKQPKKKSVMNPMASIWGVHYQCKECEFRTSDISKYNAHSKTHVFLRVCELCDYTTSSKIQYVRHKRKHKEEKRFKCHMCGYMAKHNMSLVYHLKTHSESESRGETDNLLNCEKCGFKTTQLYKYKSHICYSGVKWYNCEKCSYATRRRSDLRRHNSRKHNDGDEWVPP